MMDCRITHLDTQIEPTNVLSASIGCNCGWHEKTPVYGTKVMQAFDRLRSLHASHVRRSYKEVIK